MSRTFRHADGRIMVDEGTAGGIGGGAVHTFHREATEEEAAAYVAANPEPVVEGLEEVASDEPDAPIGNEDPSQ